MPSSASFTRSTASSTPARSCTLPAASDICFTDENFSRGEIEASCKISHRKNSCAFRYQPSAVSGWSNGGGPSRSSTALRFPVAASAWTLANSSLARRRFRFS